MKKLLLFIILLTSTICYSQNEKVANVQITNPAQPKPVIQYMPINKVTDSIIKKDTFEALQTKTEEQTLTIQAKDDSITAKTIEVKTVKENSIPVGNGNGLYLIIGIVLILILILILNIKIMKKLLLFIILLTSTICYSQNEKVANAQVTNPAQPKPVYQAVTINKTTDSVIKKDTFKTLQIETVKQASIVQAQADTIKAKNNEIIAFKDYFKNELWNGLNPFVFYSAFIFGFIGLIFMWLCKTYFAAEQEYKWKLAFSAKNIVRSIIGLILAILTIYLTLYIFPIIGETAIITNLYALIIGASWQVYAKKLMKYFEGKAKTEITVPEVKENIINPTNPN